MHAAFKNFKEQRGRLPNKLKHFNAEKRNTVPDRVK